MNNESKDHLDDLIQNATAETVQHSDVSHLYW